LSAWHRGAGIMETKLEQQIDRDKEEKKWRQKEKEWRKKKY